MFQQTQHHPCPRCSTNTLQAAISGTGTLWFSECSRANQDLRLPPIVAEQARLFCSMSSWSPADAQTVLTEQHAEKEDLRGAQCCLCEKLVKKMPERKPSRHHETTNTDLVTPLNRRLDLAPWMTVARPLPWVKVLCLHSALCCRCCLLSQA